MDDETKMSIYPTKCKLCGNERLSGVLTIRKENKIESVFYCRYCEETFIPKIFLDLKRKGISVFDPVMHGNPNVKKLMEV